nr:hypothetical protein [Vespula vulgaris luteo-like virus 1]
MESSGSDSGSLLGVDQPSWRQRIRRWLLLRLLPYVILLSGVPILSMIVLGALHGLWQRIYSVHLESYRAVRDWVAGLDPMPDPPSRNEQIAEHVVNLIKDFDYYLLLLAVTGIATLLTIWFVACWTLRHPIKRVIYRMQGIEYESMRPGSDFIDGAKPCYQVEILQPGSFGFSHVHLGFGLRVSQTLMAVPTHVIQGMTEVMIKGPKSSIVITPKMLASRLHSDLTYVHLDSSKWSNLGVPIAKLVREAPAVFGKCHGMRGYSMGRISKSRQIKFMVVYEGSTEPGMSGAPYLIGDAVAGMHCGVLGEANSGISASLIIQEVAQLVSGEAIHGGISSSAAADSANYFGQKVSKQIRAWDEAELARSVKAAYSTDWNTLNSMTPDYNAQLNFDEERSKSNVVQLMGQIPLQQEVSSTVMASQNSNGSDQLIQTAVVVEQGSEHNEPQQTENPSLTLEERVFQLEVKVRELENKQPQVKDWQWCSYCQVQVKHMTAHVKKVHRAREVDAVKAKSPTQLKVESAVPSDSKVLAKLDNSFLEKRTGTKKQKKSSRSTSNRSASKSDFTRLEELLSKMVESQNRLEQRLGSLPMTSPGQSSGTTLK